MKKAVLFALFVSLFSVAAFSASNRTAICSTPAPDDKKLLERVAAWADYNAKLAPQIEEQTLALMKGNFYEVALPDKVKRAHSSLLKSSLAKVNMTLHVLRPNNLGDPRVLEAFSRTGRETAFSTPNHIFLMEELVGRTDEDILAAIIAHEMGHLPADGVRIYMIEQSDCNANVKQTLKANIEAQADWYAAYILFEAQKRPALVAEMLQKFYQEHHILKQVLEVRMAQTEFAISKLQTAYPSSQLLIAKSPALQ